MLNLLLIKKTNKTWKKSTNYLKETKKKQQTSLKNN